MVNGQEIWGAISEQTTKHNNGRLKQFCSNLEFLRESLDVVVVGDVQPAGRDALDAGELVQLLGVHVGRDHGASLLHELERRCATDS